MWIRERLENPPTNLSTWRKMVIVVMIAFATVIAVVGFNMHMEIQATAPDHPVPAHGQVYPVDVNHGYIRLCDLGTETELWPLGGPSGFVVRRRSNDCPALADCSPGIRSEEAPTVHRLQANRPFSEGPVSKQAQHLV